MSSYILFYGDLGGNDCYCNRGEDPIKLIKAFDDYYEGDITFKEVYENQDAFLYELSGSAVEVQFKVEVVTKATPTVLNKSQSTKAKR